MTVAGAALALAIGVAMGLFGGGGSLLLVPALTYLMGFDAKQAVTTSLAVVGISAAVGSAARLVQGMLPIRRRPVHQRGDPGGPAHHARGPRHTSTRTTSHGVSLSSSQGGCVHTCRCGRGAGTPF
jgi:hypothetical protein